MNKKIILVIVIALLTALSSFAAISPFVKISGTVESVDREKVMLKTSNGKRIYVPRRSLAGTSLNGHKQVEAQLKLYELVNLNKKYPITAKK